MLPRTSRTSWAAVVSVTSTVSLSSPHTGEETPQATMADVKVEVRAVGLKAMREKKGLTQRKLAHDLGISQNYIPAIEGGARHAGPKVQQQMVKYFRCEFEDLFEVVLVDGETRQERRLYARE